jgi:hypothetical protein
MRNIAEATKDAVIRCAAQRNGYSKVLVLTGQTDDRVLRRGPQSNIYKAVTALHLLKDSAPVVFNVARSISE